MDLILFRIRSEVLSRVYKNKFGAFDEFNGICGFSEDFLMNRQN